MGDLTIKGIDDDILKVLHRRALKSGLDVAAFVKRILADEASSSKSFLDNHEIVKIIEQKAQQLGISSEELIRFMILAQFSPPPEERAAEARRIRDMTPRKLDSDSTEIIRRLRDES